VKILVTPDVEEPTRTELTAEVDEDTLTKISFDSFAQNGDTDEEINSLKIKVTDVEEQDFTLYLGDSTTTQLNTLTAVDGYYELTPTQFNNIYVQYTSDLGNSTDTSFGVIYTTIDKASTLSDISSEITATYNLSLNAVTDEISIDTAPAVGDNIVTENGIVTINNTGTFTISVALNAVASDNGDTDNSDDSEVVTRLVVEGVPNGIEVDGGVLSQTQEGINLWFVDIPDTTLDGSYDLKFTVNDNLPTVAGTQSTVKITAYNQDGEGSEIEEATTQLQFVDNTEEGTYRNLNASLNLLEYEVIEDTTFTLANIISITTDDVASDVLYTLSFKIPENVSYSTSSELLNYTTVNGTEYVVEIGSATNIQDVLESITFTPTSDFNANNDQRESIVISPTLTVYQIGTTAIATSTVNFVEDDVTPVTDAFSSSVSTTIDEDTSYTFDISLKTVDDLDASGNFSDDGANSDGSDYIITTDITVSYSGIQGVVTLSDDTKIILTDGKTFTLTSEQLNNLVFTPSENESGTATFTYKATTKENGASNEEEGIGVITIDVTPVADGLELDELNASGDEFTDSNDSGSRYIELTTALGSLSSATLIDSDDSEEIQTIILNGIPNGFLVYIGDDGDQTMAQNAGDNGSSSTFDLSGTEVGYNTWNIPLNSDGTVPSVWIKAPEHWSGDVADITFKTIVKDGSSLSLINTNFDLEITPVASGITINPTNTFTEAYKWTDINLNANMTDLDGSETLTVTLTGDLDDTARFKLGDGTIMDGLSGHPMALYNDSDKSWTLSNIPSSEINNIEILYHHYSDNIAVSVQTVDGTDTLESADIANDSQTTGSFEMDISESENIDLSDETIDLTVIGSDATNSITTGSGDDTIKTENLSEDIEIDAGEGYDILDLNGDVDLEDIDLSNIEELDMSDNNTNDFIELTAEVVKDITDEDDELVIVADNGDEITLEDGPDDSSSNGDWEAASDSSMDGFTEYTTGTTNPTITVFVDNDVDTTGGL